MYLYIIIKHKGIMKTLEIIKHYGNPTGEFASPENVRLYDMGETKRDVIIDLQQELKADGGFDFYEAIIGSGSEKYTTPDGFKLICVGAKTRTLNEKGNPVCRTVSIIAAYLT